MIGRLEMQTMPLKLIDAMMHLLPQPDVPCIRSKLHLSSKSPRKYRDILGSDALKAGKAMKEATRLQLSSMNAYGPLLLETNVVTTDGTLIPIWIVNCLSLLVGAYQLQGSCAIFSTKPIQRT